MFTWNIVPLSLELSVPWKIARSSSSSKLNFMIEVEKDGIKGIGEAAPNIRYGENSDVIQKDFSRFICALANEEFKLETLDQLMTILGKLDICRSLRFAIESSFVHYMAFKSNQSVAQIIGTKAVFSGRTSYSISILPLGEIQDYIKSLKLERFSSLKIKLDKEEPLERIRQVLKCYNGNLRLDGNEAWNDPDEALSFISKLDSSVPIDFIEQPLPAHLINEAKYFKKNCPFSVMADESVLDGIITQELRSQFDSVNIKLMKSGGYFKAVKQISEARKFGFQVMIGCMVESGLGISSALNIAHGADFLDLDGSLLIKNDPNPHILEENGKIFMSHIQ